LSFFPLHLEFQGRGPVGAVDVAVPDIPEVLDGPPHVMLQARGPQLPQAVIELVEQADLGDARYLVEGVLPQGSQVQLFQLRELVQDFHGNAGKEILVVLGAAQVDGAAPAHSDGGRGRAFVLATGSTNGARCAPYLKNLEL
jgi:hypothetical protein